VPKRFILLCAVLILAGCAGANSGPRVTLAPGGRDWDAALSEFSPERAHEIRGGLPVFIDAGAGLDPSVYEQNAGPGPAERWPNWTIDLDAAVRAFNRKFARPDAAHYRLVRTATYGSWRTESGILMNEFKLDWTFVGPQGRTFALESLGQSAGFNELADSNKVSTIDARKAFADAYLRIVLKLARTAQGEPDEPE
jgi:hypothetical protein